MGQNVEIGVRSKLLTIVTELQAIAEAGKEVSNGLKGVNENVGEQIKKTTRKTEGFLSGLTGIGRRVADELKRDFSSLASISALSGSLKMSKIFGDSVTESVHLSDTIHKLARVFGLAEKDFISFQSKVVKGLGDVGLGAEEAENALKGLSETQVRGQENLIGYAKSAGQLASVTGERGREGDIAKGMAKIQTARGLNPNDMKEMQKIAETIKDIFNATGMSATKSMSIVQGIFDKMPQDLRKQLGPGAIKDIAAVGAIAGPDATKFLEQYLSASPVQRMVFDQMGFKDLFSGKGLNTEKFKQGSKNLLGQYGGDPRLMAKTLGLSEDAAEGFVRLTESLDRIKVAQDNMKKSTGTLTEQFRSSMGLAESFGANINKVKAIFATPIAAVTRMGTKALQETSKSEGASAAVVGGGAIFTAMLAGGALRGIGKGLFGKGTGIAEAAAYEKISGDKVQAVYVTNTTEIGNAIDKKSPIGDLVNPATTAGGTAAGLGIAGTTAMVASGAALAYGAYKSVTGTEKEKASVLSGNVGGGGVAPEDVMADDETLQYFREKGERDRTAKMGQPIVPTAAISPAIAKEQEANAPQGGQKMAPPQAMPQQNVKVILEIKDPRLKATTPPSRGVSYSTGG